MGSPVSGPKKLLVYKGFDIESIAQNLIFDFGANLRDLVFGYHFLIISLLSPYKQLHVQNWQQDVRGASLGDLVFGYHFLIISLLSPYKQLHVQNWQQDVRAVVFGELVFVYHFLTVPLRGYVCRIENKM